MDAPPQKKKPSQHDLRVVSANSEVDPRTVARYFAGLPVRDLSRQRIERALAALASV